MQVNARATYSLSFGGACPDLFLLEGKGASKREWTLYMPKAYNPLLLQQHRQNLQKARKDVSNATAVSYAGPKSFLSLFFFFFVNSLLLFFPVFFFFFEGGGG
jgi:hypothetical protein